MRIFALGNSPSLRVWTRRQSVRSAIFGGQTISNRSNTVSIASHISNPSRRAWAENSSRWVDSHQSRVRSPWPHPRRRRRRHRSRASQRPRWYARCTWAVVCRRRRNRLLAAPPRLPSHSRGAGTRSRASSPILRVRRVRRPSRPYHQTPRPCMRRQLCRLPL